MNLLDLREIICQNAGIASRRLTEPAAGAIL